MSQAQVNRDKNALRGLWLRVPKPRTMDDIHLAAGEDMYKAVIQMVIADELIVMKIDGRTHYDMGLKMKPYKDASPNLRPYGLAK